MKLLGKGIFMNVGKEVYKAIKSNFTVLLSLINFKLYIRDKEMNAMNKINNKNFVNETGNHAVWTNTRAP